MDLTPVIRAIVTIICAVMAYFIIPYIKSMTTEAQRKAINKWVRIAVAAAEQIYIGSGRGEEKKKYVLEFLASRYIYFDEEAIDALIEAAVYELKNGILPEGE